MPEDTMAPRSALRAWLTASAINVAGTVATASALLIVIYQATRNAAAASAPPPGTPSSSA